MAWWLRADIVFCSDCSFLVSIIYFDELTHPYDALAFQVWVVNAFKQVLTKFWSEKDVKFRVVIKLVFHHLSDFFYWVSLRASSQLSGYITIANIKFLVVLINQLVLVLSNVLSQRQSWLSLRLLPCVFWASRSFGLWIILTHLSVSFRS